MKLNMILWISFLLRNHESLLKNVYGYYFEEYAVIVVLRMSKFPMIGKLFI